jgi:hypothetical protein
MKIRTLVVQRQYFGLEARAFRTGAARALARISPDAPTQSDLDADSIAQDFRVDPATGTALLHALVAGGLLQTGRDGKYRATTRMREYALARVVAPLPRTRGRTLLKYAAQLAARINAHWTRNPLQIRMIAVTGSYMSRRDKLSEITLWVVVRPRGNATPRRFGRSLTKAEGAQQIVAALRALSSFIVVRLAVDTSVVERPFVPVFQADDADVDVLPTPSWARFREWGASISRRLTARGS